NNYTTKHVHSIFFFSSRRRHTRSKRDWSSDVCSSDLDTTFSKIIELVEEAQEVKAKTQKFMERFAAYYTPGIIILSVLVGLITRSEERRVGEGCSWELWAGEHERKCVICGDDKQA